MKRIALSVARDRLSLIVNEVAHGNERVVLECHGRAKAAIVGIRDLEQIEAAVAEDRQEAGSMLRWLENAERHMATARTSATTSTEALRELRQECVAEESGLYRRQRRPQTRRRRGG